MDYKYGSICSCLSVVSSTMPNNRDSWFRTKNFSVEIDVCAVNVYIDELPLTSKTIIYDISDYFPLY